MCGVEDEDTHPPVDETRSVDDGEADAARQPGRLAGQITVDPKFDELPPGFELFDR